MEVLHRQDKDAGLFTKRARRNAVRAIVQRRIAPVFGLELARR
jgi:hypothetical protein